MNFGIKIVFIGFGHKEKFYEKLLANNEYALPIAYSKPRIAQHQLADCSDSLSVDVRQLERWSI